MHCKVVTDWEHVKRQKWSQAKTTNERENRTGIAHTYRVGDLVLLLCNHSDLNRKLDRPTE